MASSKPSDSPHLERVLYNYKNQASNTMQGPGLHGLENNASLKYGTQNVVSSSGAYNFKKSFIYDGYHRNEGACIKVEEKDYRNGGNLPHFNNETIAPSEENKDSKSTKCSINLQKSGSPVALEAFSGGISFPNWQATITPCGDIRGQSASQTSKISKLSVISQNSSYMKEEPKVILIKKNTPPQSTNENNLKFKNSFRNHVPVSKKFSEVENGEIPGTSGVSITSRHSNSSDEPLGYLLHGSSGGVRASTPNKSDSPVNNLIEPRAFLAPPPFPPLPLPALASADPGVLPSLAHGKSETYLDGEPIACFYIGGEPRLCMPHILNTVLRKFPLELIVNTCDELQIFVPTCSKRQLEYLKIIGVLPPTSISSGLITKTDAQRLIHALLYANYFRPVPSKVLRGISSDSPKDEKKGFSPLIRVLHNCFGKCKGIIWTDLYTNPMEPCVECLECNNIFTTMEFVCHAHDALENRTCHWGFDADNWRVYVMLSKDQNISPVSKAEAQLQAFKNKFSAKHKRKQVIDTKDDLTKKVRCAEDMVTNGVSQVYSTYDPHYFESYMANWGAAVAPSVGGAPNWTVLPLFTKDGKQLPLPPAILVKDSLPCTSIPEYLSQGPPVLLDPGRVVPLSDSEKFERNFQPNVALAPRPPKEQAKIEESKSTRQIIYEKVVGEKESKYVKMEPLSSGGSPLPPEEDAISLVEGRSELVLVKLDSQPVSRGPHGTSLNFSPAPDLELSTTDSDTESVNSVSSKSEVVEEAEALLRGWTDRAAAQKVLAIVASLTKQTTKAQQENQKLRYHLQQIVKSSETEKIKTIKHNSNKKETNEKNNRIEERKELEESPANGFKIKQEEKDT